MCVCIYACMYVCIYVCMYVYMVCICMCMLFLWPITSLSLHSRYLAANGAIMRTSILGILNFNGSYCSV